MREELYVREAVAEPSYVPGDSWATRWKKITDTERVVTRTTRFRKDRAGIRTLDDHASIHDIRRKEYPPQVVSHSVPLPVRVPGYDEHSWGGEGYGR